jgi:hypothetical protein
VVNKSEPNQKVEKEEVLTITVVVDAVVMVVETAVVEKTVVVETEEDINIFSITIVKKKVSQIDTFVFQYNTTYRVAKVYL